MKELIIPILSLVGLFLFDLMAISFLHAQIVQSVLCYLIILCIYSQANILVVLTAVLVLLEGALGTNTILPAVGAAVTVFLLSYLARNTVELLYMCSVGILCISLLVQQLLLAVYNGILIPSPTFTIRIIFANIGVITILWFLTNMGKQDNRR